MKLMYVLLLALIILLVVLLLQRVNREGFFQGGGLNVSWVAPQSQNPLTYNWAVCSSSSCDPDPSKWATTGTAPTASTGVLTGGDFNQPFNFAVQSVDTVTGLTSSWTQASFNLNQVWDTSSVSLSLTDSSGNPLSVGSSTFSTGYNVTNPNPPPSGSYGLESQLSVTRGSSTYYYQGLSTSGSGTSGSYSDSFGSGALGSWAPSAPGALQLGDVVSSGFVAASGSQVYFYATTSQTINTQPPAAPSGLSWSLY